MTTTPEPIPGRLTVSLSGNSGTVHIDGCHRVCIWRDSGHRNFRAELAAHDPDGLDEPWLVADIDDRTPIIALHAEVRLDGGILSTHDAF